MTTAQVVATAATAADTRHIVFSVTFFLLLLV